MDLSETSKFKSYWFRPDFSAISQSRFLKVACFNFCLILLVLAGCKQAGENEATALALPENFDRSIPGSFSSQAEAVFDSAQIDQFFERFPDLEPYEAEVKSFYQKRSFSYAWFENGILIEQAGNLATKVMNLEDEGIYKPLTYQKELDSLLYGNNQDVKARRPDINLELMLTAKYFVYSRVAWEGMPPSVSLLNQWYLPRKKVAYEVYLDSLLKKPANRSYAQEPVYRQYELLKVYLKKYRTLEARETWLPLTMGTKLLKPGDSALVLARVKDRLFKLEDFRGDTASRVFDENLALSLKKFQERHGLPVDGLLTKATVEELNVPLKNRVQQIIVNMERCRWLPVKLDSEYLAVNIPEYKLHVYRGDSLLWSCNAVVGETGHPTSLFYGEIKYVVFSPYWNIPPGILQKEILPAMRKDRRYLAKNNMEITGYRAGVPVIRQKPGPNNALGLVKFLFPNSYNIYLHDTPAKSLFGESSRAFSHGCIRIAEPAKLAAFLLKDQDEWTPEKIKAAMHAGKERHVTLKNTVPVYIAYFTAFVDRSNKLNLRKDIYNLDDRLAATIIKGEGGY